LGDIRLAARGAHQATGDRRPNHRREGFPARNHRLDWSAADAISTSRHDAFAGCN